MNKLSSRKLWLAALTSLLLVHLSACLFTVGTALPGHELAAVLIAAALTVLGYVRDITVAYLGANAIGHVVGAVEAAVTERRAHDAANND
jgi:uncharacterized membrane protein YccC